MSALTPIEDMVGIFPNETLRVWVALKRLLGPGVAELEIDQQGLAEQSQVTQRQVRRALSHLEDHGYLKRISAPPKPTRIIVNRGTAQNIQESPESGPIEPPYDVVIKAADKLYSLWVVLWTQKMGVEPRPNDMERQAARALVIRHWTKGMGYVEMEIRAAFEHMSAPLLSRL